MPVPPVKHGPALGAPRHQQASDRVYLAAVSGLTLFAVVITVFGHLGPNAQIYAFFARLSNAGVNIFDSQAMLGSAFSRNYLDFTPFNLLLYKLLFWSKVGDGGMIFRAYQFSYLFLGLFCVRQLAKNHLLTYAQELSLIALTAFNFPVQVLIIGSADDKTSYFAVPLTILVLNQHPRFQSLLTGFWAAWSGLGLFFLPVSAIQSARQGRGKSMLLLLLLLGVILAASPFFPRSHVMLANRSAREALPPFWFSIWRLVAPLYSPWINKLCMLLYASGVWLVYAKRRLAFTPALVAICLSYCLFSNNTPPARGLTTLFLAVLLIRAQMTCYLFTASIFLMESLAILGRVKAVHRLGLLNPDSSSHAVLLINILLVNLLTILAMYLALSRVTVAEKEETNHWVPAME